MQTQKVIPTEEAKQPRINVSRLMAWAQLANDKLARAESEQRAKEEGELAQKHQLQAEAPVLWSQLKRYLVEYVKAFDALRPGYLSIRIDYSSLNEVLIKCLDQFLELSFYPTALKIVWTRKVEGAAKAQGDIGFHLEGCEVRFESATHETAEMLLEKLLP